MPTVTMTISELTQRVIQAVGKPIHSPIVANKGAQGLLLETLTGIPHTSNSLDCTDGELKVYPVIRNSKGVLVPKETVAVCMLSTDDLRESEFEASRPGKKMSTMLVVPYQRDGENITFLEPFTFRFTDHPEITAALRADYDTIRQKFLLDGTLTGATGALLQNRTKGAGHGSTSRAFYLRKEFMKSLVPIHLG
jgi:DNA mismatch repair protein MutH